MLLRMRLAPLLLLWSSSLAAQRMLPLATSNDDVKVRTAHTGTLRGALLYAGRDSVVIRRNDGTRSRWRADDISAMWRRQRVGVGEGALRGFVSGAVVGAALPITLYYLGGARNTCMNAPAGATGVKCTSWATAVVEPTPITTMILGYLGAGIGAIARSPKWVRVRPDSLVQPPR